MHTPLRALALALLTSLPLASVGGGGSREATPDRAAIVFAKRDRGGAALYVLASSGGTVTRLTSPRRVAWGCSCRSGDFDDHPAWSPDGKLIAFTRGVGVYVINADGTDAERVAPRQGTEDYDLAWSRDGRLAFVRSRLGGSGYVEEIVIARPRRREARVVAPPSRFGYLSPAWSPDGRRLAYLAGVVRKDGEGGTALFVVPTQGGHARLAVSASSIASPTWSPDGSSIAFVAQPTRYEASDLYVLEPVSRRLTRLTRVLSYGAGVFAPTWSPDGKRVLFTYAKKSALFPEDGPSVYTISPDDHRRVRLATNAYALGWSPDGSQILVLDHEADDGRPLSLAVLRSDGSSRKRALVALDRKLDGLWQAPPSWRG